MKDGFIPLEKQSKRKQREANASRRGDWGGINPVTRKPPNPKAYNRKKSGKRFDHESLPGLLYCAVTTASSSTGLSVASTDERLSQMRGGFCC